MPHDIQSVVEFGREGLAHKLSHFLAGPRPLLLSCSLHRATLCPISRVCMLPRFEASVLNRCKVPNAKPIVDKMRTAGRSPSCPRPRPSFLPLVTPWCPVSSECARDAEARREATSACRGPGICRITPCRASHCREAIMLKSGGGSNTVPGAHLRPPCLSRPHL